MERLDLGGDLVVLAESSTVWVTSEAEQERDKDTKCVGCKICVSPSQCRSQLYRRFTKLYRTDPKEGLLIK